MKISLRWLRELTDTPLDGAAVAEALTRGGFEVESRARFGELSGVVVAEVRGKMPHPNAAKLTLVDVWDGSAVSRVVCGAPNVPEPGARVLWARPGARLPSGVELAAKEVRGILSPGMLCADDELGFGVSHAGIIVLGEADRLEPGDDLAAKLGLPDEILEAGVGPNRPDCLGHAGIARELAALTGASLRLRDAAPLDGEGPSPARVELVDAEGCPRYTALALDGVRVGPSPLAVRVRLASLGQRALSNVVDATNLILLETGQPLHAFDLDQLGGNAIVVRRARAGEKMVTLDGQERTLDPADVVICDSERPVAIAGVMGGSSSEVSASTTRVLLEIAYFAPASVRRTAKRLNLHTEASHRFERGTDPEGVLDASRRCARLLVELAQGRVVGPTIDLYPRPIEPRTVELRVARTAALLGCEVPAGEQAAILGALGLEVTVDGDRLRARVPTRRPDLSREVDLIEEVARVRGYDRIPSTLPRLFDPPGPSGGDREAEAARDALTGLGFDEVVSYSFVAPHWLDKLDPRAARPPVRLANPIREELSVMRTTLIAGLLGACERNRAHGVTDLRLFEVGEIFLPSENSQPHERRLVAGLMSGRADGWLTPGAPLDFADLKGAVVELLAQLGHTADYAPPREPVHWLHPRIQAEILVGGSAAGVLGEFHPDVARALALESCPLVFEIDLRALGPAAPVAVQPLPRFPAVTRDLSFFIADEIPAARVVEAIAAARSPLLEELRVLEVYSGEKTPPGKKGMLWSFTYRAPDRTLTDAEVQALHDRLRDGLQSTLQIEPR